MDTKREMSRAERIEIISLRDGFLCFYPECTYKDREFKTEEDITFDHWIPRSQGGTWDVENLRLMHKRCNALKGDRMPLPDGTLPSLRKEPNSGQRRAAKRAERVAVCLKCNSGRALDYGENCDTCGSGPMPATFPQWAQMKPKDCDHELFHCWACMLGIYERPAAIHDVVNSGELDP